MRMMLMVAMLVLAACGKSEKSGDKSGDKAATEKAPAPSGFAGGCDRRAKEQLCGEYRGTSTTAAWAKEQCPTYGEGSVYVEACPKDGALLRCVLDAGTEMEIHLLFYAPMTKEAATARCGGKGMEIREP